MVGQSRYAKIESEVVAEVVVEVVDMAVVEAVLEAAEVADLEVEVHKLLPLVVGAANKCWKGLSSMLEIFLLRQTGKSLKNISQPLEKFNVFLSNRLILDVRKDSLLSVSRKRRMQKKQ
jgi:hypothetical protein